MTGNYKEMLLKDTSIQYSVRSDVIVSETKVGNGEGRKDVTHLVSFNERCEEDGGSSSSFSTCYRLRFLFSCSIYEHIYE